tara:strand:+ start:166 stop:396 length:231 start_codon:yes stop_codon:yes gene_type:complete
MNEILIIILIIIVGLVSVCGFCECCLEICADTHNTRESDSETNDNTREPDSETNDNNMASTGSSPIHHDTKAVIEL